MANEVAIFVTGLILSWLIAFIVSYIIVKIILNRMGIPWAKMNKQERVITLNSGGLACFPGIIFSLLYAVRFEEIVVSMITIPSTVVWFLGMMIAPALGFRLAIS